LSAASGREVACLSIDGVRLSARRLSSPQPAGRRLSSYDVNVTVQALQLDMFAAEGGGAAVALASLPDTAPAGADLVLKRLARPDEEDSGGAGGWDLDCAWLHLLRLQLPSLRVVVDDALIGLVLRLLDLGIFAPAAAHPATAAAVATAAAADQQPLPAAASPTAPDASDTPPHASAEEALAAAIALLRAHAAGAAEPRLYVQELALSAALILLDVHVAPGSPLRLPGGVALDVRCRTPPPPYPFAEEIAKNCPEIAPHRKQSHTSLLESGETSGADCKLLEPCGCWTLEPLL
jgi:hypothetical protein